MNKPWSREDINDLLINDDIAVMRAIVRLFKLQTEYESKTACAKTVNGQGFSAADAKAGTRMARWLLGMNDKNQVRYKMKDLRHPLCLRVLGKYCRDQDEAVIDRARRIALKHSMQLVLVANNDLA
jgi:hypothetical protein